MRNQSLQDLKNEYPYYYSSILPKMTGQVVVQ